MTLIKHFPVLQVLLPFLGALFSILTFHYVLVARIIAVISVVLSLLLSIYGLSLVNKETVSYNFGDWHAPIGIEYRLDYLNQPIIIYINCLILFFLIFCHKLVATTILKFIDTKRQSLFYAVLLFAHSGYLGMVSTNDLFNLYVFIEISSLSACVLIAQGNNPQSVIGAFDYLMLGTVGATLILIGIGFLLTSTGSLNMLNILDILQNATFADNLPLTSILHFISSSNFLAEIDFVQDPMILHTQYKLKIVMLGISFFVIGSILKTAFFPMHFWMIRAYYSATPVILTYLASVSSIIGIHIILRFIHFTIEYNMIIKNMSYFIKPIALVSIILCTYFACRSQKIKNVIIYSSAVQIGYIFLLLVILRGESLIFPFLFADSLNKVALFLIVAYSDNARSSSMLWRVLVIFSLIYSCGLPISSMFFIKITIFELLIINNMWIEFGIVVISSTLSLLYHYKIAKKLCWHHCDRIQLNPSTNYSSLIFISIVQFFLPVFLTYK